MQKSKLSQQLINDLVNPGNTNITPGLSRMHAVLTLLNNPQHKYKVIHITGTNGKGSTATFIETGLIHAGYLVGKFSSPYIRVINESIVCNNKQISDDDFNQAYFKIKSILMINNLSLSPFEFLTVIMFDYFSSKQIDWLILEVGMGGENDSTNVVSSNYSIITNVSLEHTQWLGNSIAEIAKEKSGIIKGGLTIIADNQIELIQAVETKTTNYINVLRHYPVTIELDKDSFTTKLSFVGQLLLNETYHLSLFGKFQAYNFLCAYAVFKDLNLSMESIRFAASNTYWPGRMQVIHKDPVIMLDATHNLSGSQSLLKSLDQIYKKDEVIIITSILRDKDIRAMLGNFSQISDSIIYTTIDNNPRGMPAKELSEYGQEIFNYSSIVAKPSEALVKAKSLNKKLVLITGSLYLLSYFY